MPSEDAEPTASFGEAARERLVREESIDIWTGSYAASQQRGWSNFRAENLRWCSGVGGEQVLKKQYLHSLPPVIYLNCSSVDIIHVKRNGTCLILLLYSRASQRVVSSVLF